MQPFFHCAVAASLLSVGTVLILDALVLLGIDQIDIFDHVDDDVDDERLMMQDDSNTEEDEADSHPELGEGDLLPQRAELPLRAAYEYGNRKRRSRRTRWSGDMESHRGVKRCEF